MPAAGEVKLHLPALAARENLGWVLSASPTEFISADSMQTALYILLGVMIPFAAYGAFKGLSVLAMAFLFPD